MKRREQMTWCGILSKDKKCQDGEEVGGGRDIESCLFPDINHVFVIVIMMLKVT